MRYHCLSPGDGVLIHSLGLKGKQKLADHWSATPYVVESQMFDLPVYHLKLANGSESTKVMYRNHLLPLGQAVRLSTEVDTEPLPSAKGCRCMRAKESKQTSDVHKPDSSVDMPVGEQHCSDSKSEYGNYLEDMIINNSEEICKRSREDVKPTETYTANNVTEISTAVASLTPSEDPPAVVEESRTVEQDCFVEGRGTRDKSDIDIAEPEIKRSERPRQPTECLLCKAR